MNAMNLESHLERHLRVPDSVPHGIRIAFASSDMKTVDQHFGSCQGLLVYDIGATQHELIQAAEFQIVDGHSDVKVTTRIAIIEGCTALYCNAVGKAVYRELMHHGIKPVCVESGTTIQSLIQQIQSTWDDSRPAHEHADPEAMLEAWDASGWDED